MKVLKGITCCGDCIHYNWKKHKCNLGCKDEGLATDHFYKDCPLPKAQPVNQWIPCSERLPIEELEKERSERGENAIYPVMVTAKVFSYEENEKIIRVKEAFYMEHEGRLFFSDTYCNEVEVVAWMPLPEPYKESD